CLILQSLGKSRKCLPDRWRLRQVLKFQESLQIQSVRGKFGLERVAVLLLAVREGQFHMEKFFRACFNVFGCLLVCSLQQGYTRLCPLYSKAIHDGIILQGRISFICEGSSQLSRRHFRTEHS